MAEEKKDVASLDDAEEKNTVLIKPSEEKIISLDVGGMKFKTTNTTLNKSAYFKALLSGKFGDRVQSDGSYFIDRDGEYFKYLLNYMRYGYVSIPAKYAKMIHLEALFYQIKLDLSDIIE